MTEDQRRALASMSLHIVEFDEGALHEKRAMAEEIVCMEHVSPDIMRKAALVYVGSHVDIELALLLDGRNIELVDPCFVDAGNIMAVEKRIAQGLNKKVRPSLTDIKFDFDFGDGEEEVTVRCRPYVYRPSPVIEETPNPWIRIASREVQRDFESYFGSHSGVPTYEPLGDIGMLLSFSGVGVVFDQNRVVMDRLVKGGYILTNPGACEELPMDMETYLNLHELPRFMWVACMMSKYRFETDYVFIPLGSIPPQVDYCFIRKEY